MKYFQHLIGVFVLFGAIINGISLLETGRCSTSCKKDKLSDGIVLNSHWCSCSPSCVQFGDCCLDSPFRKSVGEVKKPLTVCLSVDGIGVFSAIGSCSPTWKGSHDFCRESIGHLPPVSSLSTDATYVNVQCAICNGEARHPEPWKVELKCCSEPISSPLQKRKHPNSQSDFFFKDGSLWQWTLIGKTKTECKCKYQSQNGSDFVSRSIPLRNCNGLKEISKCSWAWPDPKIRQQCQSYIDPVYIHDRIYRNVHCAKCNYDTISHATCIPSIMNSLYKHRKNLEEIREYCAKHRLNTCLHYIQAFSKGRKYFFSDIFAINMKECIPTPGSKKKCCNGERYDYRIKRCRKSGKVQISV